MVSGGGQEGEGDAAAQATQGPQPGRQARQRQAVRPLADRSVLPHPPAALLYYFSPYIHVAAWWNQCLVFPLQANSEIIGLFFRGSVWEQHPADRGVPAPRDDAQAGAGRPALREDQG